MQSQGPTVSESGSTGVPPGETAVREEDSGLHDIRSLASSQRMRNSSRRITTSPPVEDTILAASSAGWKAVALPVAEQEMPAPLDTKRASRSSKQMAAAVAAASSTSIPQSAPTPIGAHLARKQKSKAPLYAIASFGLAAAAGAAIYVTTKNSTVDQAATIAASSNGSTAEPVAKVTPIPGAATATPIEQAPAAPAAGSAATGAATTSDNVVAQADTEKTDEGVKDSEDDAASAKSSLRAKGGKKGRADRDLVAEKTKTDTKKPDPKADKRGLPGSGGVAVVKPTGKTTDKNEEPSFEELLKEANIPDKKQAEDKPKLEKKSLSSADIKKGMSSVAAKAQGCYNGTQGTAAVKLVVDPSGKVSKVSVSGAFAGTPVAACVEKAVKGASFPPWDGGPQSFGYSYLLSE